MTHMLTHILFLFVVIFFSLLFFAYVTIGRWIFFCLHFFYCLLGDEIQQSRIRAFFMCAESLTCLHRIVLYLKMNSVKRKY